MKEALFCISVLAVLAVMGYWMFQIHWTAGIVYIGILLITLCVESDDLKW